MSHGLAAGSVAQSPAARPSGTNAPTEMQKQVIVGEAVPTVASPKFTEPLRDTPQTIVAVPREVFTQQGAVTLSDVLRNTPGITFAADPISPRSWNS